ncbi:hypothetical protein PISL3812_02224 [Talaromyces islandicus]|uniref:Uncharacterized protein n=1 Tax=Talaromyces islandicus TaxID=28573 RepID=A0A0U1LQ06_TALIS|nr:hypothetical protein PISL3812_02224 [Talaromyces islandicus]
MQHRTSLVKTRSLSVKMDEEYSLPTNVAIHLALSVLDLGISAAAGAAAAATGAHVNGDATTAQILRLGALGGLIKSGILNAAVLLCLTAGNNIFLLVLLAFAGSSFGSAVLATSVIALRSLGDVPNELLIAAVAAGAPLTAGTAALDASGPVASIQSIGWDALSGYTFARVAQNHDIIGIGIRISIYILSLASPLISFFLRSAELSHSIESSLGVTGLALFLTTVIQTALGGIALFHALCVLHLLGLVGISIRPRGNYPASAARDVTLLVLYVVAVSGSLIYFIYVFANAPHFGNQPQCNAETKYVLFGVNMQATNDVIRWIFVAVLAMLSLALVMWLMCMSGAACCLALDCCRRDSEQGAYDYHRPHDDDRLDDRQWSGFIRMLGQLGASIYMMVTLELIIRRNKLLSNIADWKFGQVLAMMMLIGPLIEAVSLLLGKGKAGSGDHSNSRRRENQGFQGAVARGRFSMPEG